MRHVAVTLVDGQDALSVVDPLSQDWAIARAEVEQRCAAMEQQISDYLRRFEQHVAGRVAWVRLCIRQQLVLNTQRYRATHAVAPQPQPRPQPQRQLIVEAPVRRHLIIVCSSSANRAGFGHNGKPTRCRKKIRVRF